MVEALVTRRADVVYGSRFLVGKRVTTVRHRLINWALTTFANLFTRLRLTDVHTCLKLFRAEVIRGIDLEEDRFGFCPEVTAKLAQKPGLVLVEAPVSYQPRSRRLGKKVGIKDGLRALYCIVKYTRARHTAARPGRVPWGWVCLLLLSVMARLVFFDFQSIDYRDYLSHWYDFFLQHGRWHGLCQMNINVSNYPPLYLYSISLSTLLPLPKLYAIKLLSVAGDYLAAWYIWRLVRRVCPGSARRPWVAMLGFLFLPTVVMNGALWGQCDILYTTGFLASLLYIIEGRPMAALVAFGFSCALKPQAIFWCPLLAGLFISGRLPWKWFWIPGAVYAACGLPSILAGRAIVPVLMHWALVKNLPGLTLHAPNWYQLVSAQESSALWTVGVALTLVATGLFIWRIRRGPASGQTDAQWLVSMAFMTVLFPPFFLPGMHERYFFAADVLAVVYAVSARGGWVAVPLLQFASGFAYCPFLFGRALVPEIVLPVAVVLAMEWVLKDVVGFGFTRPAAVSAAAAPGKIAK